MTTATLVMGPGPAPPGTLSLRALEIRSRGCLNRMLSEHNSVRKSLGGDLLAMDTRFPVERVQ